MQYTVILSPRASADIWRTVRWLSAHKSVRSAERWHQMISDAIELLSQHPKLYPEADEAGDIGINLRECLQGRKPHIYRILYSIQDHAVNIHYIRHAAQDRLTPDDF